MRDARTLRVPYIAIVGRREVSQRRVTVRNRDTGRERLLDGAELAAQLAREVEENSLRAGI